jgi:hypothetical protein
MWIRGKTQHRPQLADNQWDSNEANEYRRDVSPAKGTQMGNGLTVITSGLAPNERAKLDAELDAQFYLRSDPSKELFEVEHASPSQIAAVAGCIDGIRKARMNSAGPQASDGFQKPKAAPKPYSWDDLPAYQARTQEVPQYIAKRNSVADAPSAPKPVARPRQWDGKNTLASTAQVPAKPTVRSEEYYDKNGNLRVRFHDKDGNTYSNSRDAADKGSAAMRSHLGYPARQLTTSPDW